MLMNEFKYGWDADGNLIKWDVVSPSYAHFHKEDENFTKTVTEFTDDLLEFHARFLSDREKYKDVRAMAENQPPNFFDVTCPARGLDTSISTSMCLTKGNSCPVITWGQV